MEEAGTAPSGPYGSRAAPLDAQGWLAAIVDSSDDAIISKSLDGTVLTWNLGAERMFGYSAAEIVGTSITRIIPTDRLDEEPRILKRIAGGERIDHFDTVRRRKDGELINVSMTISPVCDAAGRIVGASKIARDVTQSRRVLQELAAAKRAADLARESADRSRRMAEAANLAKDHFLGVLSHELRTPLTPALMAIGLIEHDGDLPDSLRARVAMVRRNIETQARLVDDLLDLTRITRGKLALHFEIVDAHDALRNVADMFENEVKQKTLGLRIALEAEHCHVWADPGRFQQMLLNLVSNAVKFTPERGAITLQSRNRPGRLVIEVTDNGIGIPPEIASRLFQPFEQAEDGGTRRFGGLGLGLSIVKSLVTMHSGEISFASAGRERGTTFTLVMPLAPARTSAAPAPRPLRRERVPLACRVLLVEDHADTREVMDLLLRRLGCTVVTAASVREATGVALRDRFDLLICDFGLPDGTGADVIAALYRVQPIRAIAVTGYGQDDDLRRSRDAGFLAHLTKPVNVEALHRAIEQALQKSAA